MKRAILLCTLCIILSGVAQAKENELCVKPGHSGCYNTIQDAVNAAQPGDKILVYPHPDPRGYRENVVVNIGNLTIRGLKPFGGPDIDIAYGTRCNDDGQGQEQGDECKKTCPAQIVDGCETTTNPNSCGGNGFGIEAPGVKIQNFTIRHYGDNDSNTDNFGIIFQTSDVKLTDNCILDSENGIAGTGDRAEVERNRFFGIQGTQQGQGNIVQGENLMVRDNKLVNTNGVRVSGNNAKIVNNHVELTYNFQGTNRKIKDNVVRFVANNEYGIQVRDDAMEVSGNKVSDTTDNGILFQGNNNFISNISLGNGRSDIRNEGDEIVIKDDKFIGNQGEGINNAQTASNTFIVGNISLHNRIDICNDGTIAVFNEKEFVTGGTSTACVVEQ